MDLLKSVRSSLAALLLVACAGGSQKDDGASSNAKAAPQIAYAPATRALDAKSLTSHWAEGDARLAAEAFAQERWQEARDAFAKLSSEDDSAKIRAELMVALCDAKLGEHSRAAKAMVAILPRMPLLADYLHNAAARSFFFARDYAEAMKHARAVDTDSVQGADALLLIGDILRSKNDHAATLKHYARYLETRSRGIRRPEARYRVAEATEKLGRREEAAAHYKKITVEAPLSRWSQRSQERLEILLKKIPEADRKSIEELSAEEWITRAKVLYDNQRNDKAEVVFASALSAPGLTPELRCVASYHRANSVFKLRNRTKAAPLFLEALDACERAKNADLYVKAAYQAGRSYATLGQHERAIHFYKLIESKHPEHTYADDARLHQAEEYRELKQEDKVEKALASIPDLYPQGDMRSEALWRLAWRAYKAKKYAKSIEWLNKQINSTTGENQFWAEGQALYWIGRAQGQLGKTDKSIAAYQQVVREYPLSYYSLLALNRLRESHRAVFDALVVEIHSEPAKDDGSFHFRERDEYQTPRFSRALEFLKLGLPGPAGAELGRLGFKSPPGRDALSDPDTIDRTWAVSVLHYNIGDYSRALWSTRWHLVDYKRHWPVAGWRKRWDIAYPPGYWLLIDKYARAQDIPPELIISFVREESGFDPIQESVANAIGLSQIIMPTAKRFAEGTGIVVSRETLRDPDKNLHIGSRFMSFLMKKWDKQISLVAPSYNAGEGAVARWMKERGSWDRDAWAEEIPYDETRRYSKRVIASYFTYRYLRHDEIPVFPNR
jgi:soluble lytic murein transglycosylase